MRFGIILFQVAVDLAPRQPAIFGKLNLFAQLAIW
jgi:hypothetical protein